MMRRIPRTLESSPLGGDSEHSSLIDLSSKEEEAAPRCDHCVADHLAQVRRNYNVCGQIFSYEHFCPSHFDNRGKIPALLVC